jgi:hypothetical protein
MDERLLSKLALRNPLVAIGIRNGAAPEDIISALVAAHEKLVDQYMQVLNIAPMKQLVDGKVYIWRCPDEFIPFAGQW